MSTEVSPPVGPAVRLGGIRKAYGDTLAVRDVDLSLHPGQVHALCGHNGAGKSTVVRMLSGQEVPDAGTITIAGEVVDLRDRRAALAAGIALVDQELSVVPSLSVAENLVLGAEDAGWLYRRRRVAERARRMLDEFGLQHIEPNQPLSSLALGERQLVEIARAFGQRARLVILDEPTATLSDVESARVYTAVRQVVARGAAVLFVSHRLGEVLELCDRITVMRDGQVVADALSSELSVENLIEHILGEAPQRSARHAAVPGPVVLKLRDLAVPGRVAPLSMEARAGSVYAFAGQVGSGASDLLRALAGLEPAMRGVVEVAGRRLTPADPVGAARDGVAFASNDRKSEGLFLSRTVGVNLVATRLRALSRAGVVLPGRWRRTERDVAHACGLEPRLATPVGHLSGGNQQKVFVGRALGRSDVRLLLLDEPTRGVDVGGRSAIHDLIRRAAADGLTVMFASTELDELVDLADVVITLHKGKVVARHDKGVAGDSLLFEMTHGSAFEPQPARGGR